MPSRLNATGSPRNVTPRKVLEDFRRAAGDREPLAEVDLKLVVANTVDSVAARVARAGEATSDLRLFANRMPADTVFRSCTHAEGQGESMLDFTVYRGRQEPFRLLVSAESEGFDGFGINEPGRPPSTSENNGYLWDLWKLLQVPSPVRLFVARITRHRRADGEDRCLLLRARIREMVADYAGNYSTGDAIFSIVLPCRGNYDDVACDGWWVPRAGQVSERWQ